MRIERMTAAHADAVLAIYQAGIDEGNATFETTAPTWDEFDSKRMPEHRFVGVDNQNAVVGGVAALHRAVGFRILGTLERIGQHHGRWRDVVLIERRSPSVGPTAAINS